MKEWILKAAKNRDAVDKLLGMVDQNTLSSGQLLLTPAMIPLIFRVLGDGDMTAENVRMTGDGGVSLDIRLKNGMSFRYVFRPISAVVRGGQLIVKAKYSEEKLSAGIGSALLNLTGKTGLAIALGKNDWAHVDGSNVEINRTGLPQSLSASLVRCAPGGFVFRIE